MNSKSARGAFVEAALIVVAVIVSLAASVFVAYWILKVTGASSSLSRPRNPVLAVLIPFCFFLWWSLKFVSRLPLGGASESRLNKSLEQSRRIKGQAQAATIAPRRSTAMSPRWHRKNGPVLTRIRYDASLRPDVNLRSEKITTDDLALIRRLELRDWNDQEFDSELQVKYGYWVVNEDKSIIFKALGGGALEIPEMYEFVYEGQKIRLECGGGGDPSTTHTTREDQSKECVVHVDCIEIPPGLLDKGESLLELIVKAFEAHLGPYISGDLVVEFKT